MNIYNLDCVNSDSAVLCNCQFHAHVTIKTKTVTGLPITLD